MGSPNPPPVGASQLSEREWDKLINIILEGFVVPVIGQELLIVPSQSGQDEPLYDVWGRALAEQAGLALPEDDGTPALYQVTNQLSQSQNSHRRGLCDPAAALADSRKPAQAGPNPQLLTVCDDDRRPLAEGGPG
jgi:hypothetical protein